MENTSAPTIFVQIASYRDPELVPTIRDLFEKSSGTTDIHVCIAHQFDESSTLEEFAYHPSVQVIYIPHQESQGCCWARHQINEKYNGEDYTIQLDSHHRFAKDWDTTCIEILSSLPGKPVLTTYLPSYNPTSDYRINNAWCMELDPNHSHEIPSFRPYYSDHSEPKPTYFFSGHFAFARGQFVIDVPYDPELYFHGEEITMAARSYCAGYDLYHPHKVVAWHEYTRQGRTKVWDDDKTWWQKDLTSKDKVKKILSGEIAILGERSLEEYKTLAGI